MKKQQANKHALNLTHPKCIRIIISGKQIQWDQVRSFLRQCDSILLTISHHLIHHKMCAHSLTVFSLRSLLILLLYLNYICNLLFFVTGSLRIFLNIYHFSFVSFSDINITTKNKDKQKVKTGQTRMISSQQPQQRRDFWQWKTEPILWYGLYIYLKVARKIKNHFFFVQYIWLIFLVIELGFVVGHIDSVVCIYH